MKYSLFCLFYRAIAGVGWVNEPTKISEEQRVIAAVLMLLEMEN